MENQIIQINLIPNLSTPAVVRVSQYDVGRPLVFKVYDGTSPADLTGVTAVIEGTKKSGLGFSESGTVSGNTVTLDTTLAMTQEDGSIPAEIRFTKTGEDVGTANFILAVEKSPHEEGTTDGTTETMADLQSQLDALDTRVEALEGGGGGLTEAVKSAMLQIAQKVAYIDENGQTYYNALYNALYPPAELVSISAVYTQSGTVYDTDTLDSLRSDLVVTALMSDSTTRTVTDYTLSGTLEEGTSTITVSYGGKTDTFSVTVTTRPVLSGITANFNQGTAEILDTDNLSVLNQYLTVTADYTDGTHTPLTSGDYVLSGTLYDPVSTITATYDEFSDTFTVNVSQTVIPAEAYKNDTTLTTFTSNSARTVMKDAFYGCSNLQSVSLPNVTEIKGGGNFRNCGKLETVNLKSVTRIENSYAFGWAGNNGSGLTVVLPNITYLGAQTFGMANKMIAVDIGAGLSELLNDTFYASVTPNTTLILRRTAGVVAPRTADTIKCIKDLYVPSALVTSYQTASFWSDRYSAGTITIHAIEGSQYEGYYADGTAITT